MRTRVGDNYRTVSVCGSLNEKHLAVIAGAVTTFEQNGFTVLAPKIGEVKDNTAEFLLFDSDVSDKPEEVEAAFIQGTEKSDVTYVCSTGGYIGFQVAMELGALASGGGSEVYFMSEPSEPVVRAMAGGAIISVQQLCEKMKIHNEIFSSRDWWDAELPEKPNFSFLKIANLLL